jgi:multiple antibiotic resistance protein
MSLMEYLLLVFSSLFVIIDPIAAVPTFLVMTPHNTTRQRTRMAMVACIVAAVVLVGFAIVGQQLFKLLGITMPAFQIAGSVLLMLVALDMLRARRTEVKETLEETTAGMEKNDIAVTPLAVPILAGPGACSTVLLLHHEAHGAMQLTVLYASIVLVCLVSFGIFWLAARHARLLPPITLKVVQRLMGLLLAAIAAQFFLDGVKASGILMSRG